VVRISSVSGGFLLKPGVALNCHVVSQNLYKSLAPLHSQERRVSQRLSKSTPSQNSISRNQNIFAP
jgi:hypothetical protein